MRVDEEEGLWDKTRERFIHLFFQMGADDVIDDPLGDEPGARNAMVRGGNGDGDDDDGEDNGRPPIEAGRRSEYWFEKIDEKAKENYKRSIRNESYLKRLDYRTVWIARILTGVAVSLISAGILFVIGL